MVKANQAAFGRLSDDSDSQNGGDPEGKLAQKLREPGVMDRLYDLSSSGEDESDTRAGNYRRRTNRQTLLSPSTREDTVDYTCDDSIGINVDSEGKQESIAVASGDRPEGKIVDYMKQMVKANQAAFGRLSDDSDSENGGDPEGAPSRRRPKLAQKLREPGVMDRLFDLSSSGDEDMRDDGPKVTKIRRTILSPKGMGSKGFEFRAPAIVREASTCYSPGASSRSLSEDDTSDDLSYSDVNEEESRGDVVNMTVRSPARLPVKRMESDGTNTLLKTKKNFAMSNESRRVSMHYHHIDARKRLEQRLNQKRGAPATPSSETESISKGLVKRLGMNEQRHRISMIKRQRSAKGRLLKRLKEQK